MFKTDAFLFLNNLYLWPMGPSAVELTEMEKLPPCPLSVPLSIVGLLCSSLRVPNRGRAQRLRERLPNVQKALVLSLCTAKVNE